MAQAPRLDEFTKEEWREIVRHVRPDWTDEKFEQVWKAFIEMKYLKALH